MVILNWYMDNAFVMAGDFVITIQIGQAKVFLLFLYTVKQKMFQIILFCYIATN